MRPRRPVATAVFRRPRERPVEVIVAQVPGLVRADRLVAPPARDGPRLDLRLPALAVSAVGLSVASTTVFCFALFTIAAAYRGDIPDGWGSSEDPHRDRGPTPLPLSQWRNQNAANVRAGGACQRIRQFGRPSTPAERQRSRSENRTETRLLPRGGGVVPGARTCGQHTSISKIRLGTVRIPYYEPGRIERFRLVRSRMSLSEWSASSS